MLKKKELEEYLAALKEADHMASMSDNAYHISGRYAARQANIRAVERELKELEDGE